MDERIKTDQIEQLRSRIEKPDVKSLKAKKWHAHGGHELSFRTEQRPHFRLDFGASR